MIKNLKRLFGGLKRRGIAFGKLLIESTGGNPKRKLLQYSAYFLIILAVNFLVGKNIGNTRYPWYSNVSIFLLVNINIILIMVLMLVIFRNLAKLLSDAHSNVFGSRLKVKLVTFSVMITVVPVTVVFFFASTIINDSINKWFDSQVDSALSSSVLLMEDYQRMVRQDLFDQSVLISQIITDKRLYRESEKEVLEDFMKNYVGKNLAVGVSVYDRKGRGLMSFDNLGRNYIGLISDKYLGSVLKGNKETGYDFIDNMQIYWVGVPISNMVSAKNTVYGALFTYKVTPKRVADDIDLIQESRDTYSESEFFSFPIKKSYFMMLLLLSFLMVFAGIWGSILFAKSITKPIEALADASVEISRGNLEVSVPEQGGNEIGYLIRTFNRMAKQLNVHTQELHTKNEILSEMYTQISRDNMYIDAIFKNVDSAIVLLSQDLKALKSNAKADNIFAYHKKELEEKVFSDISEFIASSETEYFKNVEIPVNGENRIYSVSLTKISSAGDEQMLLVLDDITDIINAQRITVWKEVATRIAHEVKNPLTPIKLVAERVKKRSGELADGKIREIIGESMDTIVIEADNLLELVEEFNMFARLPKAKKYPLDIGDLINETLALYTETYPGVSFRSGYSGDLSLNGDRRQLRRVFQNLISNAIFATGQEGVISVTARPSGKNDIEIKVNDNGIGIKKEDIFKIFEPYFSKRSGGTGLGLAIVKKIVEEHEGRISAESSCSGTTFTVILPRGIS